MAMSIQSWMMYLLLVLVATSTPGPAVLFIMTNSTLHGWRKAMFAAAGNISGLLVLGVIAITGLGTILKTSEVVFSIVKYAGAFYLSYLGLKMIFQKTFDLNNMKDHLLNGTVSSPKIYIQAFGVAVSNPKAIVFLTALFPQFINVGQPLAPQFSLLIATLMAFSFGFLMLYALLADKAKFWLTNSKRVNIVNRVSGTIFIGFGLLLASSSNK